MIIESIMNEYRRYKSLVELAVDQVPDVNLHKTLGAGGNSVSVIMNHVSGNLRSRFTNFLTEDGEKPWRNRDIEFEERLEDRATLLKNWEEAWAVLLDVLSSLEDTDLSKVVRIRGQELTVSDALERSLAHASYHVGQIVLLAQAHAGEKWKPLSIPRGKSREYNQNPTIERQPKG